MICPECVDCTEHYGYDVVFTIGCLLNGHRRLVIGGPEDEEE